MDFELLGENSIHQYISINKQNQQQKNCIGKRD